MPKREYDAGKAHEYYERTKHLKGRKKGAGDPPAAPHKANPAKAAAAQQKVAQIEAKLTRLRSLLQSRMKDSGKSTQADKLKDRQDSKEYRAKHKNEIKNDRAKAARKSGGGGGKSSSSMSTPELKAAIRNTVVQLKQAIADARSLRGG